MQAKRLLGVVVGSNVPSMHQRSFEEGEEAAKIIEDYGSGKIWQHAFNIMIIGPLLQENLRHVW